jgi:citrate synthase
MRIISACLAAFDPPEPAVNPRILMSTAKRVLATMVAALPQRSQVAHPGMAALLWSRLSDRPPTDAELRMLNGAMIVLADHDLASSTRAVRSAAAGGLDASALIRLAMDSGSGVVKGVASLAVESFLHNLTSADTVGLALNRRLKQGEPIPGFGHPLYATADRRADHILQFVRDAAVDRERLAMVEEVIALQRNRGVPPPNAGFALAAMTYVAGLIPGAGETIFVVSRSVGWVAHAIEALESDPTERITSTYVGKLPGRQ